MIPPGTSDMVTLQGAVERVNASERELLDEARHEFGVNGERHVYAAGAHASIPITIDQADALAARLDTAIRNAAVAPPDGARAA